MVEKRALKEGEEFSLDEEEEEEEEKAHSGV